AALDRLLPMQQADFEEILTAMSGLPVTIRLLDPPLHEFLPDLVEQSLVVQRLEDEVGDTGAPLHGTDAVFEGWAAAAGGGETTARLAAARRLLAQVRRLSEMNPMLGTRGVRLALLHPPIAAMQVRAGARGARAVSAARDGRVGRHDPRVEIMVPLVGFAEERRRMREVVDATMAEELASADEPLSYAVGTMIELPRAALVADRVAEHAEFFSFGTNDIGRAHV